MMDTPHGYGAAAAHSHALAHKDKYMNTEKPRDWTTQVHTHRTTYKIHLFCSFIRTQRHKVTSESLSNCSIFQNVGWNFSAT